MIRWFAGKLLGQLDDQVEQDDYTGVSDSEITSEEVFLSAASRFLDLQMTTNDVFDNRTSNALSIGSTVLPVTFGLLGLSSRNVSWITGTFIVLALAAYVLLLFSAWRASKIRVLAYRPNMDKLQENSEEAPGVVLQRWIAAEYVASTEFNKPKLQGKGLWVGRANTALYVEGLLLSLAAITTLL